MITAVRGPNFSGRTDFICGQTFFGRYSKAKPAGKRFAYFDLMVPNYFSGIASTVAQELRVSTVGTDPTIRALVDSLKKALNFAPLESQNPYVLSGGEQSVLGVLIALLLEPVAIGVDCALEQLTAQWREILISKIVHSSEISQFYCADNRFSEFEANFARRHFIEVEINKSALSVPTLKETLPIRDLPTRRFTIDDLTFRYKDSEANVLEHLSLELQPGNIYQLQGANGAGKSTLSKLLAGILKPDTGTFLVDGKKTVIVQQPGLCFAYHFQNPDFQIFSTSVRQEIAISSPLGPAKVSDWLSAFGLSDFADRHPLDLPYTLRKRLALVATLAMERPWIILDEPSLGQDEAAALAICDFCGQYARCGGGVIVISHSLALTRALEATKLTIKGGRLC